jgi:hypothetical protein
MRLSWCECQAALSLSLSLSLSLGMSHSTRQQRRKANIAPPRHANGLLPVDQASQNVQRPANLARKHMALGKPLCNGNARESPCAHLCRRRSAPLGPDALTAALRRALAPRPAARACTPARTRIAHAPCAVTSHPNDASQTGHRVVCDTCKRIPRSSTCLLPDGLCEAAEKRE